MSRRPVCFPNSAKARAGRCRTNRSVSVKPNWCRDALPPLFSHPEIPPPPPPDLVACVRRCLTPEHRVMRVFQTGARRKRHEQIRRSPGCSSNRRAETRQSVPTSPNFVRQRVRKGTACRRDLSGTTPAKGPLLRHVLDPGKHWNRAQTGFNRPFPTVEQSHAIGRRSLWQTTYS
jgi:hypothetical protein